jgi:hypothetical protein
LHFETSGMLGPSSIPCETKRTFCFDFTFCKMLRSNPSTVIAGSGLIDRTVTVCAPGIGSCGELR